MSNERDDTTMNQTKRRPLVPKLRFPEFREAGEWEEETLGSLLDYQQPTDYLVSDTNYNDAYRTPVLTAGKTFILGYTNEPHGIFNEGLPVIIFDDFTTATQFVDFPFKAKSSAMKILQAKGKVSIKFMYEALQMTSYEVGAHERHWISKFAPMLILVPHPDEQQKIADCLTSLDELIRLEAEKLAALKTHKKGLMQQLFPAEGKTLPKLRFPEFREVGEWVEKFLEDVAPLQRGFDLPSDQIQPGTVPIVYSNGIQKFHDTGMAKGPGLLTGRSGTIGKLHFIEEGEYWPHNTALWVTSFRGNLPKFVYYLYTSIGMSQFASGSGVPTLNRNDVHAYKALVPSSIDEQQKIADCLSFLDDLIAAQSQKLDTLTNHKKGLMQQLFPVLDEAGT